MSQGTPSGNWFDGQQNAYSTSSGMDKLWRFGSILFAIVIIIFLVYSIYALFNYKMTTGYKALLILIIIIDIIFLIWIFYSLRS